MVRTPVLAIAGGAVVVIFGLVLSSTGSAIGTVITVVGIVLLMAFLLMVFRAAWSGDQKRAWDPGSLRREDRDERGAERR